MAHNSKPSNHPYSAMSKGNMLMGYARGAVGDLVFSRVKGNQVTKARNRQPSNPKTSKQVYQRAKFINAVRFYQRGVQNLFKFAYEDKTAQESDFNAFMRHNTSRAIPVGKNASEESIYPAISNWITSFGSLNGPQAVIGFAENSSFLDFLPGRTYAQGDYNVSPTNAEEGDIPVSGTINAAVILALSNEAITTFGGMCTSLKGLMEGDIVTVTLIHQILQGIGQPGLLLPGTSMDGTGTAPAWKFAQFIIDTTSTKPIADAFGNEIYLSEGLTGDIFDSFNLRIRIDKTWQQVWNETEGGTFDPDLFQYMSSCVAGVVTFSRETPNGLRVSTQELSTSEGFQKMIELSKTTAFTEQVLQSWGAADMAILEGGFIKA